jgi:hypothetical protein
MAAKIEYIYQVKMKCCGKEIDFLCRCEKQTYNDIVNTISRVLQELDHEAEDIVLVNIEHTGEAYG